MQAVQAVLRAFSISVAIQCHFSTPRAPCMDPWRSQIRCSFYFSSQQCACFQVVVLAGAGRLPSSGSAPLSATALEHRVRHPASLWGSARHASGAQTRIRASNCASNRQRAAGHLCTASRTSLDRRGCAIRTNRGGGLPPPSRGELRICGWLGCLLPDDCRSHNS